MKKGQSYGYLKIAEFAKENNYEEENLGNSTIGESFIVLKHQDKDLTISFVLTGQSGTGYIYECVYSDVVTQG